MIRVVLLALATIYTVYGIKCIASTGSSTLDGRPENRSIVECETSCSMTTMVVENYVMEDGTNQTIFVGISRGCGFNNRFIGPNGGCLKVSKFGRMDISCLCITDYCNL